MRSIKTSNIAMFQRTQIGVQVVARAVKKETEPQQLLATDYGGSACRLRPHRRAQIACGFRPYRFAGSVHCRRGLIGEFSAGLQSIF